jgi:hypothetical protein
MIKIIDDIREEHGLTEAEWKLLRYLLLAEMELEEQKKLNPEIAADKLSIIQHKIWLYDRTGKYAPQLRPLNLTTGSNYINYTQFSTRSFQELVDHSHHNSNEPRYLNPPEKLRPENAAKNRDKDKAPEIKKPAIYPFSYSSIEDLVRLGIELEMNEYDHYSQRQKQWLLIQQCADEHFGEGALLKGFKDELEQTHTNFNPIVNRRRIHALKRACCIVLATTIIVASIAAAILSYGTLSPAAFIAAKIGFGIGLGALGGTGLYKSGKLIYRQHEKSNYEDQVAKIKSFCMVGEDERDALPVNLPKRKNTAL